MHVWSKVHGSFPACGKETKRSSFKAMGDNSNCFHISLLRHTATKAQKFSIDF
jgi:hypothetical protein